MNTLLVRSPIYQQLHEQLRLSISRDFAQGAQFLTEREISERFQVSRATANKAVAGLVSEGMLEFRKGRGTFVRHGVFAYDVRTLVSFTEKAKAAGRIPSTKLLSFAEVAIGDVSESIVAELALELDDAVWELKRLRCADGAAVILEHRWIVQKHCPKLTAAQARGSLYSAWRDTHGLNIGGADEVIRAVLLKGGDAKVLQASPRSPALEVVAVGFLESGAPLWRERTIYRGDRYEFHGRLGPVASCSPPRGVLRPLDGV